MMESETNVVEVEVGGEVGVVVGSGVTIFAAPRKWWMVQK